MFMCVPPWYRKDWGVMSLHSPTATRLLPAFRIP